MKKLLFAAAAVTVLSSPSIAADPGAPVYDWAGPYIGLQAGYAFGSADHAFSNGAPSDDSDPSGFVGGVHAGYNFVTSDILLGLEVDAELTDVDGSFNNLTGITSSGSSDINSQGSARVRLGMPMDNLLPYATAGLAIADVDFGGGPAGGPCCGYSETMVGFTVGAGLELALSDQITTGIEYRYTDFGSASGGLPPTFPGVTMSDDLQTHAVRARLSFHF